MTAVPEDLLRSFEQRVQQQVEQAGQLRARLEGSTATVETPGGEVVLTVDASGGLADIRFRPAAQRLPLEQLGALVLEASRRAQAQLAASLGEVVAQVCGPDSATAKFVSQSYSEQFAHRPTAAGGVR